MSLTPETRKENFLARIAGTGGEALEPLDREEWFLQQIIDGGDGKGFQPKITASGILKGDGNGNVSAADESDLPRPGDPYPGVNLAEKFAAEIANYPNAQAWIKAREQAGDYTGIHVGDWLPLRANNVDFKATIMGIDTYTGYGDVAVPHHIDWILNYLWPGAISMNQAKYNNGLIPVETVSADGTATTFVLTKEMNEVNKIESGGTELSGWTYDADTYTITFETAPAAGTLTVTGTGTEYPWLASDAYHFANSLAGQVPNGNSLNPPVKHVDYTSSGVYYNLPQEWKDIIIQKRKYIAKQYSSAGLLTEPNGGGWSNIGYIWLPDETEVYGHSVFATSPYDMIGSSVQYPLFSSNMNRAKTVADNSRASYWLMSTRSGNSDAWCSVTFYGACFASNANGSNRLPVCFRT